MSIDVSINDLVSLLVDVGLINKAATIDGQVVFRDASRRNRNVEVSVGKTSYFVKCAVGVERRQTIENEAVAYSMLWEEALSGCAASAVPLPHLQLYEREHGVLVIDNFVGSRNVRDHYLETKDFSAPVATSIGTAVGRMHRVGTSIKRQADQGAESPWVLSAVHQPDLRVLRDISLGNLKLIKAIQGDSALAMLLTSAREHWRADTLIHGDLKWDNCLVRVNSDGKHEVQLVDWELATIGDSAWDTGSFLSDYLSAWVFSMPAHGSLTALELPGLAEWPLVSMHTATRAFWIAYCKELELTAESADASLLYSVRYAGVRLVQTAFEHLYSLPHLTTAAVLLLQLSANILQRPEQAAAQLLGIEVGASHV